MNAQHERLFSLWQRSAQDLKENFRYRSPYLLKDDAKQIDFSSNDYLGLRTDSRLLGAAFDCASVLGAGAGASRLVVERGDALGVLEKDMAAWVDAEACVLLGSGFAANAALFDALAPDDSSENAYEVFLDHRAHASLHAGAQAKGLLCSRFRHGDYTHLEDKVTESTAAFKFIVVEALHSMDGTFEDAAALVRICEKTGAMLIVDEAHSIGIVGPLGSGWTNAHPGLKKHVLCAMYGCGKAIGVSGGFVAGSRLFIERIFQRSRTLIFSTGVSPLIVGALQASVEILNSVEGDARRAALADNISYLQEHCSGAGLQSRLSMSPGSPIASFAAESDEQALAMSEKLLENGIVARAIRPPTVPRGTSRLRIIVHAAHRKAHLDQLFECLANLGR